MSFFDDAEEPSTRTRPEPRRRRPSGSGRRPPGSGQRPPGSGRRPPRERQSIQARRGIAAVVVVVLVILIVLGVHSCQVSQRNSALKDYNNSVASLIQQSDQTSSQLFHQLSTGGGSGNAASLQNQINETRLSADHQLASAQGLNVPDEMKGAQQNLLLALQMRSDGIATIAREIQPALGTSANKDAVNSIAVQMANFYASDAIYKNYTTTKIAAALHAAGIAVGGANGEAIESGQFLPSLDWLQPTYVTSQIGAHGSTPKGKPAPGLHGHSLDSVSVGGNTLQTGSTNTIAASPPPTFTLHFTNTGQNTETNVVLKVTVSGTSVSGQKVVPQTTAGQSTTGQVTLSSAPPTGNYTVTATVEPVPGETHTANNTQSFPVTFQ